MRTLLPVSALLLAAAILLTGSGLQGVLLPVRAGLEGFSTVAIALLGSSYFLGFAGGCLLGAELVRRIGHIRTFTAMTAIAAAVAIGFSFVVLPPIWWLLRVVSGFCFAVLYMVIESWLNERSTPQTRGRVLSAYMIINLTVITVGQLLLPLQDPRGMQLFGIVSILVSLAAVPVALSGSVAPAPIQSTRIRIRRLYSLSPAGVAACLAVGLASGPFWALGPGFARADGFSETGIALFMSAAVFGGALGQWPLGRLSDSGDRRRVILLAAMLAALASVLMIVRPLGTDIALLAMAAAWGAAAFPIYSLGLAHTNDHAAPEDFVETASGLLLVYAAGAIIGPFIASSVIGVFGPSALFGYIGGVYVSLLAFIIWRKVHQPTAPDGEHIRFVQALQAASTVSPVFDEEIQTELEAQPPTDTGEK